MPKGALNMPATRFVKLVLRACNHIYKLGHELGKMHKLSLNQREFHYLLRLTTRDSEELEGGGGWGRARPGIINP